MLPELSYTYFAKILRVIDGDTVEFDIKLGFKAKIEENIRIKGMNASEVYGSNASQEGRDSRDYLKTLLPVGTNVILVTEKFRMTFTRYVGDIYMEDGSSVADLMIAAGHGVRVRSLKGLINIRR